MKTSGKIVVYTALAPFFLFVVLAVRAFSLEGAIEGLNFILMPDFHKLLSPGIWLDAIVQSLFQLTLADAGVIHFSSMKKKNEKMLMGVFLVPTAGALCGMLCSINIFMYLGHFCQQNGLDIKTLPLSGAELSFNVFPKALAGLPWANLWVMIFFFSMVLLGIDT